VQVGTRDPTCIPAHARLSLVPTLLSLVPTPLSLVPTLLSLVPTLRVGTQNRSHAERGSARRGACVLSPRLSSPASVSRPHAPRGDSDRSHAERGSARRGACVLLPRLSSPRLRLSSPRSAWGEGRAQSPRVARARPRHFFFTPKITKLFHGATYNTTRVGVGTLCGME